MSGGPVAVEGLPAVDVLDGSVRVVRLAHQHAPSLVAVPPGPVRLSWQAAADTPDAVQVGYQLSVRDASGPWRELLPCAGSTQVDVVVPELLPPRAHREHRVRLATPRGWTVWSEPLTVEAALGPGDLVAPAVGLDGPVEGPAVLVRTAFHLDARPVAARLYLSALGLGTAWLNGRPVGDEVLAPGWTQYETRVLVSTHDVTDLLVAGRNVLHGLVGDGWYRGRIGFARRTQLWGTQTGLVAQLETTDADGTRTTVPLDGWRATGSAVRAASIYDGTTTDLRLDPGPVGDASYDDTTWSAARLVPTAAVPFEARGAAPVRVHAELPMRLEPCDGWTRLDAGQNVAGWVRLRVRGRAGQRVEVRHAELLQPSGELHTAPLRTARATDVYVLGADGDVDLEPVFTFHGFRYAGVRTDAEVLAATAVAISSDVARRSTFRCAVPELEQFASNVWWSLRDNTVSVPTDCPQRDERLGWTGDAQVIAATAGTLVDGEAFWASWLRDLEAAQDAEGAVPSVVPNTIRHGDLEFGGRLVPDLGRAGWADAATIVPMAVRTAFGGTAVVEQQLGSMRRWVGWLRARATDGVLLPGGEFQYGDWLDPDAPGERPWDAKVSSDFVSNAFYVRSLRLLARAERLVGEAAAGDVLDELAGRVAAATWDRWGQEAVHTQSGAAIALMHGIAPADRRAWVGDLLAARVREVDGRIETGFLGTPLVLDALTVTGHLAEAYRMLLRRQAPSWLYQVVMGATTVWERWDAIQPDGTLSSGAMDIRHAAKDATMISYNHYAYGAVLDWVYRTVAGLAPDEDEPGYRTVHVAPRPAEAVDRASASIDTRFGQLAIDWHLDRDGRADGSGELVLELDVPFGSRAVLDLPTTAASRLSVVSGPGLRSGTTGELGPGRHSLRLTSPAVVPAVHGEG